MKVLVTGSAGFIGSALTLRLLERGDTVIGIDNHNDYYCIKLKEARLARHLNHQNYMHVRMDVADRTGMAELFNSQRPQRVVHLAAQAGVRYSIDNPLAYIDSNLVGFGHVLEGSRQVGVEHLVYASSSSVYGANSTMPFSVHHNVDHPLSLYAATKKANELMAHSYSHLFKLPTTGLRFFTVYGPWGRPDMALQKFAQAIVRGEPIQLYNHGNHMRDFTFIDDIIEGVLRVLDNPAESNSNWSSEKPESGTSIAPWRIFNIGNNRPVKLIDYVSALEKGLGLKAKKEFLPMQAGDVLATWADVDDFEEKFNYKPKTSIDIGVEAFSSWFTSYYRAFDKH